MNAGSAVASSVVRKAAKPHGRAAFVLFCIFIASFFLRFTARVEVLGSLHVDILMAGLITILILTSKRKNDGPVVTNPDRTGKRLQFLLGYIIVTIPFVEWPGSVIATGMENFLKALCFYWFVVSTVDSVKRLRIFIAVYVACQVFRVLEPLYMHLTTGYWGSFAALSSWEFMDRLSGAPSDTINPNGLGFVVVTTLPLMHLLCPPTNAMRKILWAVLVGALLWALVLSASRSGFVAFVFLVGLFIYRSKHRVGFIFGAAVVAVVAYSLMNDLQRDRYFSIVSSDAKGAATAEGRVTGVMDDFNIAMRRPLFGHGLGTSREANANFRGEDKPSHDLYTEVLQELGFVGLIVFLMFLADVIRNAASVEARLAAVPGEDADRAYLRAVARSLRILVPVFLLFSLASYGLSEPYWYLIGGVAAALVKVMLISLPDQGALAARQLRAGVSLRRTFTGGPRKARA